MGVVLQAKQRMLRVVEDTLLDAQFSPGGPTDGRLSRGRVFDRETGTDVTDGDCLDVSCNDADDFINTFQKCHYWKMACICYTAKKKNVLKLLFLTGISTC